MNITIAGGGNIGMALAAEISRLRNYDVTMYVSDPEDFNNIFSLVDDEKDITLKSGPIKATDQLEEAIPNADVIICTYPAHIRKAFIDQIRDLIRDDAKLGFFPGYGGAELECVDLVDRGVTIFGLQKVPYIARTKEKGKVAGLMSKKHEIKVATIPHTKVNEVASLLEDMLWMKVRPLKNYMAATILPGNPLLHTSGSAVMLKDYHPGVFYPDQIMYYQVWDDECSDLICRYSDELKEICDRLPLDLEEVPTIQEYYESPTPEALTRKFHSIPSFQPLKLPMIQTEQGWIPDFSSRFYTEDMPNGVALYKSLANLVGLETPAIDQILGWYKEMTGKEYFKENGEPGKDIDEVPMPAKYGINSLDDLYHFYMR